MNKIVFRLFVPLAISFLAFFKINAEENQLKPPAWLEDAIFYQIYPQSFYDTDNDGIGDIQGMMKKLGYLKSLGINALWLNPLFDSPFKDAGYDVRDYYKVAPRYGTNKDLAMFFKEAHKMGIRVCLDLVPGHTSIDCKWFQESAKKERNAYSDRYIWTSDTSIVPNNKFIKNSFERGGNYMKNFFDCQPALNYGYGKINPKNPWEMSPTAEGPQKNKQEIMNIIDFWMNMGADGFRVDMASSLIKNDPGYVETNKLWQSIRRHMQAKFPEGILLSEWGNPCASIEAGYTMDFILATKSSGFSQMFFNFDRNEIIDTCYFDLRGMGNPTIFTNSLMTQLKKVGNRGYICIPTNNHDKQRPRSGPRNSYDQLKTVMAFLFTLPSVPLVYYGDEIGMRYQDEAPVVEGSKTRINRAGSRTPMQWDGSMNAGFSKASPEKLYLPIDHADCIPTVENQQNDPNSLLSFTKEMIQLKQTHKALKPSGGINFLMSERLTYPLVYERFSGNERVIVVINPSRNAVDVSIPYDKEIKSITPLTQTPSCDLRCENKQLRIKSLAVSYGIYKVE